MKCGKDDAAIKVLYKVVFPKVRNYIKKNGGSFEDAQDAFQDGIAIFYKQWHLGKIDLDKDIESYIFVISRNVWLNMLTKNKRVSNNIDILEEQQLKSDIDILNFMVTEERNQYIQKLLDAIGSKCKE
ncbi:MAG TPA: sigma-70 family RNA polymerase sigma factor, partial [Cytophagales bacterium]|nr:sigma-70 family RNA polymerase sigma factor [Cytophagales bacterium]